MKRTSEGDKLWATNPEAFNKLASAMEISKGKTDTRLARTLAELPNSTVDDIVRLQQQERDSYYNKLWETSETRGKELRRENKRKKFAVCFNDTFAARYMRKLGLGDVLDQRKGYYNGPDQLEIDVTQNVSFTHKIDRHLDSDIKAQFFAVLNTPSAIREAVFANPDLLNIWTSGRHWEPSLPRWVEPFNSMNQDEYNKKDKEFKNKLLTKKGKEMIMLVNAPKEIQDQLIEYVKSDQKSQRHYSRYSLTTMADVWYHNTRLEPWKLDKELEFEDFYNALDYMGIGITNLEQASTDRRKGIRQFVTHVVSSTRRFEADIKRGHSVANVRALLVEDLNMWLKQRVEDKWVVFARTDAPEHYPDIEPKKKKQPTTTNREVVTTIEPGTTSDNIADDILAQIMKSITEGQ